MKREAGDTQGDWNAPTHKHGGDSRDAAACQRHKCHYVLDEIIIGGLVLDTSITNIMGGADDQNKLHKSSLSLLTSGPKKTQIGARPGALGGYQ